MVFGKIAELARTVAEFNPFGKDRNPIDTVDELFRFATTRASFSAQKQLLGYLKTRMGTSYVKVFEDEPFMESVNIAKLEIFAECLSDSTVYVLAKATEGKPLTVTQYAAAATDCFDAGLAANARVIGDNPRADAWRKALADRLPGVNWANAAASGDVFTHGPKALVRWAPIADELKKRDVEIVTNAMKFGWIAIRADFEKRLDAEKARAALEDRYPA